MFGKHLTHVLALTALTIMAYSIPDMRTMVFVTPIDSASQVAGVANAFGRPQNTTTTDARVRVERYPTLSLSYDSARKESALTATFDINIDGNRQGIALYQDSASITIVDTTNDYAYGQLISVAPLRHEDRDVQTGVDQFGRKVLYIAPGKHAHLIVTSKMNPQIMFAGSYTASLQALLGNPYTGVNADGSAVVITAPQNKTDAVTIVGETSPYITGVISPISIGDRMTITGKRLNGASVFIDGSALPTSIINYEVHGTSISWILATTSAGFHTLYVVNSTTGQSNTFGFQVNAPVVVTPPQPGTCYQFNNNLTIGSVGADVTALQTLLIKLGFAIPGGAAGYFGAETKAAVAVYQTSVGMPATGFVGPETRAKLNSCSVVTPPVTSATPNITNVAGMAAGNFEIDAGGKVGIQGTNLAGYNNSASVFIGGMPCTITQIDNTLIYCTAPTNLIAGNKYDLYINSVSAGGDKLSSNIVQVKVLMGVQPQIVSVSNTSLLYGGINSSQSGTTTQSFTISFTVTGGNDPIFISKDSSQAIQSSFISQTGMSIRSSNFSSDNTTGDGATYFYIAPGQTKNFGVVYSVIGMAVNSGVFQVNAINYGKTNSSFTGMTITSPLLDNLKAILFH
ncbi:MAG: peptidoglycan-binding protein [Candidatus Taylorbacteria bacterium]